MKTIAFVFIPVYIEKKIDAPIRTRADDEFRKLRRVLFTHHWPPQNSEPPFWTWFIENPRPPSVDRQ
jgi:hypothetical protein